MLTIVGGTYFELCKEPNYYELYGSGLRAACALSSKCEKINLTTCIGKDDINILQAICNAYSVNLNVKEIESTITFDYCHPLSKPIFYPDITDKKETIATIEEENILFYGMNEANVTVKGNHVVYDPQNHIQFTETGSKAEHLALILNRREAILLSKKNENDDLIEIGKSLLISENAEVIVIKNGSKGALVVEKETVENIPVFKTNSVWPIGSGDIFSAVFAWQWILKKQTASVAAMQASKYVAQYVQNELYPLPEEPEIFIPLLNQQKSKKIYLAGPFFNIAERWLIDELRDILMDFGNEVFSPFHDVGLEGEPKEIYQKDIDGIQGCDVLIAVVNGLDPGTFFEIGYARAIGKKVVILAENANTADLLMLVGAECEIASDLSTAAYKASW